MVGNGKLVERSVLLVPNPRYSGWRGVTAEAYAVSTLAPSSGLRWWKKNYIK